MAVLGVAFWIVNALLALTGVRAPLVYLIGFNLAFSYAFVDVVADALMVEHGRRLKRVGSFVNFQWTMLSVANVLTTALSGWFQQKIVAGEFQYWVIFLLTGIPPLFTAAVGCFNVRSGTSAIHLAGLAADVVSTGKILLRASAASPHAQTRWQRF